MIVNLVGMKNVTNTEETKMKTYPTILKRQTDYLLRTLGSLGGRQLSWGHFAFVVTSVIEYERQQQLDC